MSKRQIFIIAGLILLVTLVVIIGVLLKTKAPTTSTKTETPKTGLEVLKNTNPSSTEPVVFSPEVPKDVVITAPSASATNPTSQGNIFGIYPISASVNGFTPNSIAVKKGDVVKIELTGTDGKYDFSLQGYGNYIAVEKGETKKVSFIPDTAGTFLFECRDFCPAGKKIQGTLIILPK